MQILLPDTLSTMHRNIYSIMGNLSPLSSSLEKLATRSKDIPNLEVRTSPSFLTIKFDILSFKATCFFFLRLKLTIKIGLRPFGVSFLFAGYDKYHGFQLYQSDPSGNYSGWKATSIGANSSNVQGILKQEYDDGMDVEAAKKLAIKILTKATESTTIDGYKSRF